MTLPPDLTSESAMWLTGAQSKNSDEDVFTLEGIISGHLQSRLEENIEDHIPIKYYAIVANAYWQRSAIQVSNLPFGFQCYPTFFGSKFLALPREEAVSHYPYYAHQALLAKWQSFGEGVRAVADRFPDREFAVYVVGGYSEPQHSAAYALMSGEASLSACITTFERCFAGASNVVLLSSDYNDEAAYYDEFFRTDHHWNIQGAFRACDQISRALSLDSCALEEINDIPDYKFTGSTARNSVDLLQERVFDCSNDFSELTALLPDGTEVNGNDHSAFWECPESTRKYVFYDRYGSVPKVGVDT